jgi:ribose-phosphate pyrophosphokinase
LPRRRNRPGNRFFALIEQPRGQRDHRYCNAYGGLVITTPPAGSGRTCEETAMKNGAFKIVAGNSNPALSDAIAAYLATPMTKAVVRRFADMEIFVEIQENVRGADVFVVQSTSFPANDHLMELLIIIDALRRASARRITAVMPYFGYARQDRKPAARTPISAKLVANLVTHAGADRVLTVDLHAGQIQGFFDIPTDNLYAAPVMVRDIKERFDLAKVMVVSPDVGGVVRARGLAKRINAPLAIIDKRRERAGESEVMNVIGEVAGYTCILVDDIVDSGGTLVNAADALIENGATDVYAYITHGVLSGGAVARITASRLKELVITDSIQPTQAIKVARNIRVLSISTLIGEAIARTSAEESVSSLFD